MITLEEIFKISAFFSEENINTEDITILVEVPDKEIMKKVNEDFYFRTQTDEKKKITSPDDIIVNVGRVKFKYVLKDENDG